MRIKNTRHPHKSSRVVVDVVESEQARCCGCGGGSIEYDRIGAARRRGLLWP